MLSYSVFVTQFPMFSTLEPHLVESALKFAEDNYCHNWNPKRINYGRMLVAAHLLMMGWFSQAEMAGSATGIAQVQTAVSPQSQENDFSLTHYGRQYLELRSIVPIIPTMFV